MVVSLFSAAGRAGISVENASGSLAAIVNLSYCAGGAIGPLLGGLLVQQVSQNRTSIDRHIDRSKDGWLDG